jgi:hypothetical protein
MIKTGPLTCDSRKDVRMLSDLERPNSGASTPMTSVFTPIRPATMASTMGQVSKNKGTSKLEPVVTKKRPRRMPLNGSMSASTRVLAQQGRASELGYLQAVLWKGVVTAIGIFVPMLTAF